MKITSACGWCGETVEYGKDTQTGWLVWSTLDTHNAVCANDELHAVDLTWHRSHMSLEG